MSWCTVERGIRRWTDNKGRHSYYVDVSRGKRRVQIRAGPSVDLARQIRGKLLVELAEKEQFPDRKKIERIKLSDFAERYIEDYLKVKAAKSLRQAEGRVRSIQKMLGNMYVDAITAQDVEKLLATLKRKGDRDATLNRYRARLNSMMKKAVAWGYRVDNPVDNVECLREQKKGDRYIQPHEFRALLDVCDPELRTLVHVAACTGMRQGELLALQWDDVDLDLGFITVRSDVSKTSECRRIPLNKEVQQVLNSMGRNGKGRVFPFDRFPRRRWAKAVKGMGWDKTEVPRLKGWRFHDLRHTCASWLVMAEVPLTKVAKILGHKELTTTQRYAHLADESLVDAMDRIQYGTGSPCVMETAALKLDSNV